MDNSIFQNVFDKMAAFLPAEWSRVVFFAGYTEGSYSMKFFVKTENSSYVDCFSIPELTKGKLVRLFIDLDKVLSANRSVLGKEKAWTIFTMIVEGNGHMRTEFEYDDHSEDMVSYEKVWAEKYLK